MKLWVDYTNHKGIRAWREIVPIKVVHVQYPPLAKEEDREWKFCLKVKMADRKGEYRYLAFAQCHEFRETDTDPSS